MAVTQLQLVNDVTRRAEALAEIQEMHHQLSEAHAEIDQLKADLHREQDRVMMMIEERDRYRHESVRFRKLALTLAVKLTDAALILDRAKDEMHTIDEVDAGVTPSSAALDALEAEYKSGTS